jgi:hypothetical protein
LLLPGPAAADVLSLGNWPLPQEGNCAPSSGLAHGPFQDAAPPMPFVLGEGVDIERLDALRVYLPPEIWEHRDRFFFDGMRIEIGPCFRDYAPPKFFWNAHAKQAGMASLLPNGGIDNHHAGLPFPPGQIGVGSPAAGQKWAWNFQRRYRAGGLRGRFRIEDLLGKHSRVEPFEGEIFQVQLLARADRPDDGYRFPGADRYEWAAGGRYDEPFEMRDFAWLQFRPADSLSVPERSDDLHLWVPAMGKARRAPASEVEGLFTPVVKVGVKSGEGENAPTQIEPKRSGFEALELRPLLYRFEVLGIQDVLTPINSHRPAYPTDPKRGFGPTGLSWASDRWELRRSLILEGRRRQGEGKGRARFRMWVDLQTMQPLYYSSYDENDERIDVGYFVGRWSEDRDDYPKWIDDPSRPVRVVDSVGAVFINLKLGSSWRRESYEMVSVPEKDSKVRRDISLQSLQRRGR